MEKVNTFNDFIRIIDGDAALSFIDDCYLKLSALPSFTVRSGQVELSKAVCRSMVSGEPLAAEAPTGTGKTLAYLIGAIAASERIMTGTGASAKNAPIVIATATVGLQAQVISGDIPILVKAGILRDDDAVIAKGRGRYFCLQSALRAQIDASTEGQYDFFDQLANDNMIANLEISKMIELFEAQHWDGDVDNYVDSRPESWSQVCASASTCGGPRQCEFADDCPFFRARMKMTGRRIIVTNQDFVLADLQMGIKGKDTVLPFKNYLLVFDEAHHLPDKAMDFGVAQVNLTSIIQELPKMGAFARMWPRHQEIAASIRQAKLKEEQFDTTSLSTALSAVEFELKSIKFDKESHQFRFIGGVVPQELLKAAEFAESELSLYAETISLANTALKSFKTEGKSVEVLKAFKELLYSSASIMGQMSEAFEAFSRFTDGSRKVRWAQFIPRQIGSEAPEALSIHASPLDGAEALRALLWDNPRVRTSMVSATIKDLNGFDRFQSKLGVSTLRTMTLEPIFPYQDNDLNIVDLSYSPRNEDREKFTEELKLNLLAHIDDKESSLILFSSKAMMKEVLPSLRHKFKDSVLAQEDKGIAEILQEHRARVDEGKGSILCGLATMAEGLDLPGNYCTHVVICSIPFAVPTTPVEQELSEILGDRNFMERIVPDALTKLTQMVGRLMRRETDRGRITIYDKRLVYTRWGRLMLGALPPFRKKTINGVRLPRTSTFARPTISDVLESSLTAKVETQEATGDQEHSRFQGVA